MDKFPANLLPDESSPEWMNKGDNAWQLTAATLVGLQSVPGLVILYGGIVKRKWAVNSAFMALYAFASVLVCWVAWGYRMSFGTKMLPFWGVPNTSLDQGFLLEKAFLGNFPNATMVFFQFVFAAITLIVIAGALLGRMNFYAWMMFVPLWLTFSYTVTAFSVWCPDGWLSKMGVVDFAGGYVIHVSSGVAGFTAAYLVGPRSDSDRGVFVPNNVMSMLTGAGLLWMGWTGFNGGAPFAANADASMAILNTHICTATSLLTWLTLDIVVFKKPTVYGITQGIITGLVCITPAAGVVQGWVALVMGILSGSIPWYTMMILQNHKRCSILRKVDDTLGVLHTHGVAGILGGILVGLLTEPKLARIFYLVDEWEHYTGLFYAIHDGHALVGARQLGVQLLGIVFVVCWNIVITSVICNLIRLVVPLRLSDENMEKGDESVHGEQAYALYGDGEKHGSSKDFNAYGFA